MVITRTINELEESILNDFDSTTINVKPKTERELYIYYAKYSDVLLQYLNVTVNSVLRPISNEIRALFGHLADYQTDEQIDKRELEKAYGHFRRLTLDAFKILCDSFDEFFSAKMTKQYHYDFRSINAKYLQTFSHLYISAKNLYIEAQLAEKNGSDSTNKENILQLYHEACKKYIELKRYYCKNKRKVLCVKICAIIISMLTVFSFVFSTIITLLEHFLT